MPDSTSTERRCDEGRERISPSLLPLSFALYLSGHVPALLTSALICLFIPHLSFIATRPSFCFNIFCLTFTALYILLMFSVLPLLWHVFFFLFLISHFTLPPRMCRSASLRMQWGLYGLRVETKTGAKMSKSSFRVSRHGCWHRGQESPSFHIFLLSNDVLKTNMFNWYTWHRGDCC